jgi:hypothetical protein
MRQTSLIGKQGFDVTEPHMPAAQPNNRPDSNRTGTEAEYSCQPPCCIRGTDTGVLRPLTTDAFNEACKE